MRALSQIQKPVKFNILLAHIKKEYLLLISKAKSLLASNNKGVISTSAVTCEHTQGKVEKKHWGLQHLTHEGATGKEGHHFHGMN